MERSLSRILIETTVRQTLNGLAEDTQRTTRNLVDMALQFAQDRGQSRFFTRVREVLRRNNSPYYTLIQDVAGHVQRERLMTFGMNLGYNSCIWGIRQIRAREKQLGFHIPWAVLLQTDPDSYARHREQYGQVLEEGERLGIYTWGLFAHGAPLLPLVEEHPDSAFFLFCRPEDVTETFLDAVERTYHLMPVVRMGAGAETACALLRNRGIPYSVYTCYSSQDAESIAHGAWFRSAQRMHPIFTVLIAQPGCPSAVGHRVHEAVVAARSGQRYRTVPWELCWDTVGLDKVISHGTCGTFFDSSGNLYTLDGQKSSGGGNLFQDGLSQVLERAWPVGEI